jgi:hypothetical protein
MAIYLFFSESDAGVFALTADWAGINLPPELGPWSRSGNGQDLSQEGETEDSVSNPVHAIIAGAGFYLGRTDSATR